VLLGRNKGRLTAKVSDFGLAKSFESAGMTDMTNAGDICGTPIYWPREQITHYKYLAPPTDVFSIAAVFYEMLVGDWMRPGLREMFARCADFAVLLSEEACRRFPLDWLWAGDDVASQLSLLMSPSMWRDIFRPLYERLTSRAHRYGMKVIQHSCGYNYELVDDLCEAGIDCLQFDQPALYDGPALAEKLRRHRVGLFSPSDIQKVLPTGDRAFIERETERLVETFRGGFIAKNYGDLHGIGVEPEWDRWAYEAFVRVAG
jgi:serine/threonine protein kinase